MRNNLSESPRETIPNRMIGYVGNVYPIHSDYEVGVCDREIVVMIGIEGGLDKVVEDR